MTSSAPLLLSLVSALLLMTTSCSPQPATGLWGAWLDSPGGELAFALDLAQGEDGWSAHLVNGVERIPVPLASWEGDVLTLDIDHYDSVITATLSDDGRALDGEWVKRRGTDAWTHMGFHARAGAPDRASFVSDAGTGSALAGRWKVQFESDDQPAAAVFSLDDEGRLSGTFMTTTGDYRYLAGDVDGTVLTLSCFDGAHAFLFRMQLSDTGTLDGEFWSRESWHETWTAERDDDFVMPDGFALTQFIEEADFASLSFPDLNGELRTLDDPAFAGKARVIQIFGSWCPNCHDASDLMTEFDSTYGERGLSILGLAFEVTGDLERDAEQVRRYATRHGVTYPLLVAGLSDKDAASEALPFLDKVRSYPTTVFLHSDGRVRAVYQGFSGPATGAEFEALRAAFAGVIEELLAE